MTGQESKTRGRPAKPIPNPNLIVIAIIKFMQMLSLIGIPQGTVLRSGDSEIPAGGHIQGGSGRSVKLESVYVLSKQSHNPNGSDGTLGR